MVPCHRTYGNLSRQWVHLHLYILHTCSSKYDGAVCDVLHLSRRKWILDVNEGPCITMHKAMRMRTSCLCLLVVGHAPEALGSLATYRDDLRQKILDTSRGGCDAKFVRWRGTGRWGKGIAGVAASICLSTEDVSRVWANTREALRTINR